jgi:hypothetical protein
MEYSGIPMSVKDPSPVNVCIELPPDEEYVPPVNFCEPE